MGAMKNKNAGIAAMLRIKSRARQLPLEEVADGRNEKQKRGRRGNVTNKIQGATCCPLGPAR
jgi:hypothetical protein